MFTKIIENENNVFTFYAEGLAFTVNFNDNTIGGVEKEPAPVGAKTTKSKWGADVLKRFEDFVMSNEDVANWTVDGLPVKAYQSGAGWYAGCYCDQGPYCRISDYSDEKALMLHWIYFNSPTYEEGEEGEEESEEVCHDEDRDEIIDRLYIENDMLRSRIADAEKYYRELAHKYNELLAAYNAVNNNLFNANAANNRLRYLLGIK